MTPDKILKSDFLDILFEGRNQSYGAYELRKKYNLRLKIAIATMLSFIALLCFATLIKTGNKVNTLLPIPVTDTVTLVELADKKEKPIEPPKSQPQPEDIATVKDNVPVIKPDIEVPETEVPDNDKIDSSAYSDRNTEGKAAPESLPVLEDEGTGTGPAVAAPAPTTEIPTGPVEMNTLEHLPEYSGGPTALARYMVNNLTSELEPGIKYVVRVQFIINEEGQVSDAKILQSDSEELNAQVLRAVKRMKAWKPGSQRGHNVAVRFVMPVTFVGAD